MSVIKVKPVQEKTFTKAQQFLIFPLNLSLQDFQEPRNDFVSFIDHVLRSPQVNHIL